MFYDFALNFSFATPTLETHDIFLDHAPGRYVDMKMDGQQLTDNLESDFPAGNTHLRRAPEHGRLIASTMTLTRELRPVISPVIRRFTDIIKDDERQAIHLLVLGIFNAGLKLSSSTARENRSASRAPHFGIWEKFGSVPRVTGETDKVQKDNDKVKGLIKDFLSLISSKIAPRLCNLLRLYYPILWCRQQRYVSLSDVVMYDITHRSFRIRNRVSQILASDIEEKPWLDFGGAFFAVAVKIGCSERDHLDWTDDPEGLTWVSGVGDWEGADLRAIETGWQFPVQPGDVLAANMRTMVHSASPILRGERITLTFFTCKLLAQHSL